MNRSVEGSLGAWLLVAWGITVVIPWGFAFFPVPADASWLAAAKSACFGTTPDGLPAAHGWMILVLGPLLFFACALVAFRVEVRDGVRLMRGAAPWRAAAAALFILFAAELAMAAWHVDRARKIEAVDFGPEALGALPDDYPRQDRTLPPFELVDQFGGRVGPESFRGRPTVLTFVFAHCQTICPVLVATTGAAVAALNPGAVNLSYLTLDPWRDTPAALPAIAKEWQLPERAQLLSGDPQEVERLLDSLQVGRRRDTTNGDVTHPALVFILDADGRIVYLFNNPTPDWIVEGVRRVLNSS